VQTFSGRVIYEDGGSGQSLVAIDLVIGKVAREHVPDRELKERRQRKVCVVDNELELIIGFMDVGYHRRFKVPYKGLYVEYELRGGLSKRSINVYVSP
jgi:hypothetical protein